MSRKRVGVLISGRGSNLAALIKAAADPVFPAEIVLVLSNRPGAKGLDIARSAGITTSVIDHKAHGSSRADFDAALQKELVQHRIDIVCLAGFMRLLTADFVRSWQGRMINVHPALLPSFKGLDTHARALAAGVKIHGATVHFVVPEVDSGPIITQGAVAVHEDDDEAVLAARVLAVEHRVYPQALRMLAEGRLRIAHGRCIIDGANAPAAALVVPAPPV